MDAQRDSRVVHWKFHLVNPLQYPIGQCRVSKKNHCHRADRLIQELVSEDPKYAAIKFHRVEESEEAALADSYDYWYVPCLYLGREKLMEGVPSKEKIRAAMDRALES